MSKKQGRTSPRLQLPLDLVAGRFSGEQNTLEHAHSIARTIPYVDNKAEKRARINRLLSFAREGLR